VAPSVDGVVVLERRVARSWWLGHVSWSSWITAGAAGAAEPLPAKSVTWLSTEPEPCAVPHLTIGSRGGH